MKKTLLVSAFALGIIISAQAQNKIDPAGRLLLQEFKAERERVLINSNGILAPMGNATPTEQTVKAVVVLKKGFESNVISVDDVEILSELNGVVVLTCPMSRIEELADLPEVQSIGFGETKKPMLDFARPAGSVGDVTDGFQYESQKLSFDGTGVICGMMDTGLEGNHINFKNSDGTSRIQRLWHLTGTDGTFREYTPSDISSFTTDDTEETHATHVAGIMGGGYKGNAKYMYLTSATGNTGGIRNNSPIPYYGVATGSDLAFSVGSLSTPNIIQGVTNIIDYAQSTGQPCVVNLSLGGTVGPHDGTDYYSRALSRLGEKGIIVMAAGNDGDTNLSITKTLGATGNDGYLRTFPVSTDQYGDPVQGTTVGVVDLWTDGSTPVKFAWKVFKGNAASAETILEVDEAGKTLSTNNNAVFSKYFSGSIVMTTSVSSDNNRYNVYSTVNARLLSGQTCTLMLEVTGASGTKLYLYGSSVIFTNKSVSGSTPLAITNGSAANSINDAACGDNIVSVGAFTTRNRWGLLNGNVYTYTSTYTVGAISPFSSYGTSYQGEKLPLICAPGANIVSSISRYTVSSENETTATAANGAYADYWGPMQGTSMACPFVSGTVALWLQACPSLDFNQVMEVINNTSTYSALTMKGGRWGAGKINALEGAKYVLDHFAAIGSVWEDDEARFMVTPNSAGYDVTLAGEAQFEVKIVDLQGRAVATARGADGSASIETSTLTPGIYILTVNAPSATLSCKIQVR